MRKAVEPHMTEGLTTALSAAYGLHPHSLKEVSGGWSARAFVADTGSGRYFVKAYDKHRPSIRHWIERMDAYMPAVLWLQKNTPLRARMSVPVLTREAAYKAEDVDFVYLVFPFIQGRTLGDSRLSDEQVHQLAQALAILHGYGGEIPAATDALVEAYELPFADPLATMLEDGMLPQPLRSALAPYAARIAHALETVQALAGSLRGDPPPHVLCHTDAHGWNLMWEEDGAGSGRLTLVDWEGLRLAPAEADLFVFTDGFFFDYAKNQFFAAYREMRGSYAASERAMDFYRLRRHLEDIEEFAQSIRMDSLTSEERMRSFHYMQKELDALPNAGWEALPGRRPG